MRVSALLLSSEDFHNLNYIFEGSQNLFIFLLLKIFFKINITIIFKLFYIYFKKFFKYLLVARGEARCPLFLHDLKTQNEFYIFSDIFLKIYNLFNEGIYYKQKKIRRQYFYCLLV